MDCYSTYIEDNELFIELPDGRLKVGTMDDIVDQVGGETYTIEYTEKEASASWLHLDDDSVTFDVYDVLSDYSFDQELVEALYEAPLEETNEEGHPIRVALFVDLVTTIWDSKGMVDSDAE